MLTLLGRVVKTVHILRYLHDSEIRNRVHLQLNRGELRHMNKVTALSVLSNAVLVWNTVRINEIVRSLEKSYRRPVLPEHVARLSPVAHGHVIPSGTYHFERASADRPVLRSSSSHASPRRGPPIPRRGPPIPRGRTFGGT